MYRRQLAESMATTEPSMEVAIWHRVLTADDVSRIYDHQGAKYSATFTSTPIDTGTGAAQWETLSWETIRPYGKELPGNADSDLSSAYSSLPNDTLMNGNVLLMHLNETTEDGVGGNDVEDFSGQGNHGDIRVGMSAADNFARLGKFGYAMEFDGMNDGINVGDLDVTGAITLTAWIKPDDVTTAGTWRSIIAKNNATVSNYSFYQYDANPDELTFGFTNGIWQLWETTSANLTVGWHFVAVTYDEASDPVFYVDGSTPTIARIFGSGSPPMLVDDIDLFIGSDDPNREFDGLIDEVAIWNRALSPTEIQELYRRGASRIRYQFRTCDSTGCDDEPWLIPDTVASGANPYNPYNEYFSELHNTTTGFANLSFYRLSLSHSR